MERQILIRLPDQVLERIRDLARVERRAPKDQLVVVLERALFSPAVMVGMVPDPETQERRLAVG